MTVGQFLWKHEGQVFRIDRQMGLCENCNKIVAMERFPAPTVLERAREMHAEYAGKRPDTFEKDEAKRVASQQGLAVLERVIKLNRTPVCLECGGSNVRPVRIPRGVSTKTKIPVCLGISHPWCGGLLVIKGSEGKRMGMNTISKAFDIYGQLIMTVKEGPP